MIDSYVREKRGLYPQSSRFACEDACPRHGCRSDLAAGAGLLEIRGQAGLPGRPTPDVSHLACKMGPFIDQGLDRARVPIALNKPCVFLDHGRRCSMHPARPAACALFPERTASSDEPGREEGFFAAMSVRDAIAEARA